MMVLEVSRENSLPLHIQLLDDLRHKIKSGVLKPHERLPGEWELVNSLDISRATIQRAWQAAEQEGLIYRVAGKGTFVSAPTAKVETQMTVGLVIPDFRSSSSARTLSGAERILRQQGYAVQVASSEYSREEENHVLRQMFDEGLCGCIVWAFKDPPLNRYLTELAGTFPLVLIDRPIEGLRLPCVTSNNYAGGFQAMHHLLELGHRRIAFLALPLIQR